MLALIINTDYQGDTGLLCTTGAGGVSVVPGSPCGGQNPQRWSSAISPGTTPRSGLRSSVLRAVRSPLLSAPGTSAPASVYARSLCVGPDRRQILFLFRIRKGSVLGCIVFMATERQAPGLGVARHTCLVWIQVSEVAILQLSSTQRQPRHSVLR